MSAFRPRAIRYCWQIKNLFQHLAIQHVSLPWTLLSIYGWSVCKKGWGRGRGRSCLAEISTDHWWLERLWIVLAHTRATWSRLADTATLSAPWSFSESLESEGRSGDEFRAASSSSSEGEDSGCVVLSSVAETENQILNQRTPNHTGHLIGTVYNYKCLPDLSGASHILRASSVEKRRRKVVHITIVQLDFWVRKRFAELRTRKICRFDRKIEGIKFSERFDLTGVEQMSKPGGRAGGRGAQLRPAITAPKARRPRTTYQARRFRGILLLGGFPLRLYRKKRLTYVDVITLHIYSITWVTRKFLVLLDDVCKTIVMKTKNAKRNAPHNASPCWATRGTDTYLIMAKIKGVKTEKLPSRECGHTRGDATAHTHKTKKKKEDTCQHPNHLA